jgi:hypothetical protein
MKFVLPATLSALVALAGSVSAQLSSVVTESGKITVSVDAIANSASIQIDKPSAAATVRGAYLMAASLAGYTITNSDITLAGSAVTWTKSVYNSMGSSPTFFNNVFADVTSIVKPIIDPAPAGINTLAATEGIGLLIDGTVLAVIFDEPSVPQDHGVILLFGGLKPTETSFTSAPPIRCTLLPPARWQTWGWEFLSATKGLLEDKRPEST